MAWSILASILI